MEAIYLKGPGSDSVSEKVDLKSYFAGYMETVKKFKSLCIDANGRAAFSGFTNNYLKQNYEAECSPVQLSLEDHDPEPLKMNAMQNRYKFFKKEPIPTDVTCLRSLNYLRERTANQEDEVLMSLKYRGEVWPHSGAVPSSSRPPSQRDLRPDTEYAVTFRIYFPFQHEPNRARMAGGMPHKFSQALMVLGRQTLADLHDTIICCEDYIDCAGDVSANPYQALRKFTGGKYKSSMFYIGNNFYIDTRHCDAKDYSKVVRDWGTQENIEFGHTLPMQTTKISDLVVRMGYPYVFQHQGNCEHLVSISDARLITVEDSLFSKDYPLQVSYGTNYPRPCMLCGFAVSMWIVRECTRFVLDTMYLCDNCFDSYCYSNGEKVGEFKAYKYFDRTGIMQD